MKTFYFAIVASVVLASSAEAGLVCAAPPEMKLLQSAALQQQLMVAAVRCHMSADYGAFVTAYRGRLQQADQALQAFFASRPRGEDYSTYKTRIANAVSLRSTRDARFCDSARKVFDLALDRRAERNGLAPEPPQLIDTGYEGCRPVDDNRLEARAPVASPALRVAAVPKPAPRPNPMLTPEAKRALALRPTQPRPVAPKPAQLATAQPPRVAPAKPAPQPTHIAAVMPTPRPAPPMQVAAAKPTRVAAATPAPKPAPLVQTAPSAPVEPSPARIATAAPRPLQPSHTDDAVPDEDPTLLADADDEPRPPERPRWRTPADDNAYADDHIPNAYRPGAEWVTDPPPRAWRARPYPPRWHHPPRGAHMVLGPDGRWIVLIGTGPRWDRD
jgi:hypothetical protein